MEGKNDDRLRQLCSRALAEKDPRKLVVLFSEINAILYDVLVQVNQVLHQGAPVN